MSEWQGYIDSSLIGSGNMHSAAIVGLADGSYWAYGGTYIPQPEEVTHILKALKDPSAALASGITIGGVKFFAVRAVPGLIYIKKGGAGGCIAQSLQAAVIGIYGNPEAGSALLAETSAKSAGGAAGGDISNNVNPADCNATVESIANYLKSNQY
jgi:profilin